MKYTSNYFAPSCSPKQLDAEKLMHETWFCVKRKRNTDFHPYTLLVILPISFSHMQTNIQTKAYPAQ